MEYCLYGEFFYAFSKATLGLQKFGCLLFDEYFWFIQILGV
jgi:hypothetical protein